MTIALIVVGNGEVNTFIYEGQFGCPSKWAYHCMGPGAYFGRLGDRDILDLGYHGIYRMHSSAGEGVVMVAP